MKYVFVDTDNGTATPGTKYQTTSSWPANSDRWDTWAHAVADATVLALNDDITFYLIGTVADTAAVTLPAFNGTTVMWLSVTAIGNSASASGYDTAKYHLQVAGSGSAALTINGTYLNIIQNLQLKFTSSGATTQVVYKGSASGGLRLLYCWIENATTSATAARCVYTDNGGTIKAINTIARNTNTIAGARGFAKTAGQFLLYNCTIWTATTVGTRGISSTAGSAGNISNCAIRSDDDINVTDGSTIDYCATLDGDGTHAQTVTDWTTELTDPDNGDFRVKSGSTHLIDTGTTGLDSGSYTDDITGTARGASYDIGAHEYVITTSLTDVDTDESITTSQAAVAYTGTGLSAANSFTITTDTTCIATATSFVATNDTSGTFTAPSLDAALTAGTLFGACTFTIKQGASTLGTLAGTFTAQTGYTVHTVTDISQAGNQGCIYYGQSPSVSVNDNVIFSNDGGNITIDSQGFVTFSSGSVQTSYRIRQASSKTWSSAWATFSTALSGNLYGVRSCVTSTIRSFLDGRSF